MDALAQQRANETQLRTMYNNAVEAIRAGQYDRASGLADAMEAMQPNSPQVAQIRQSIKTAKQRALDRMQIR
jgi:predicted Zn-dependent protease